MKGNKNEELQSRREFFKSAAKAALPIIGAAVLAGSPMLAKAAEAPMGCASYSCSGTCSETCDTGCKFYCKYNCSGTCEGGCKTSCKGVNKY